MTEGNASKDNRAMGITEFDDLTGPDQSASATAPPAFNRRSVLFGAGAAVIAATAAACAPAPAPAPAPTTTVPPTTVLPTTTSTLPPTTTTTQPGSAAGETSSQVLHIARRLSFGPTPALLGEIRSIGITTWIDQQLAWESIDNSSVDAMLPSYPRALMTAAEITAGVDPWRTRQEMAAATIVRGVWSKRQLHELLVDFWSNHLNIDINHDASTRHKPTDDRDVIRRYSTGKFADMLVASAKSPAMLLYLDQALSRADGGRLPIENYAREMLELHTVGVDGGYNEADVKEVAYLLSGWGVVNRNDGGFQFRPQWHNLGPLATGGDVLGWRPNGLTGVAAGESLLIFLARHQKTATRLAHKLAVRFIGEHIQVTDGVVTAAAQAYTANDTAIAPMVRSLLLSQEFRASAGRKMRRPIEYFAGLLRSVQLQWDPARATNVMNTAMGQLGLLGQVPLAWETPDGYPDNDARWTTAGAMVARWNLATLGSNGFGATAPQFDANRILGTPAPTTVGEALDRAALAILGEPLETTSRAAILSASGQTSATAWRSTSNARAVVAYILQTPQNQMR
ncbi:MAG: DUF1800 domain-containing protein [Actinobacteria bacterium]|nr:DUF1800 domain-containing protein [Actinomycetota bacterium]